MGPDEKPHSPEREQTDESLRIERVKADDAVAGGEGSIQDVADAVITRARERADRVLEAARARTDRKAEGAAPLSIQSASLVQRERVTEDTALREERATADATLREERAERLALITSEREDTDKDLLVERNKADEAVATRMEFLAIVSHDLRNMLGAMVGFAALIQAEVSQDEHVEHVRAHAVRIQRSGGRMNRLIGDLVDLASIEAGMLQVSHEIGDPAAVVVEAVDTFSAQAHAAGIELTLDPVPAVTLPHDAARILQVMINLLSNAMKFTPRTGRVHVHVKVSGAELVFNVKDSGRGIAADKLDVIFDRFLQLNPNDRRGIGLGLYISKAIVQGHGGRIWAESVVGGGSSFHFALPIPGGNA